MSVELVFKAKIKQGVTFGLDHGFDKWFDDNKIFDVTFDGNLFDLRADGYGKDKAYGNGSITIFNFENLIVDDTIRQRILLLLRTNKLNEIEKATNHLLKLTSELKALV